MSWGYSVHIGFHRHIATESESGFISFPQVIDLLRYDLWTLALIGTEILLVPFLRDAGVGHESCLIYRIGYAIEKRLCFGK